MKTILPDYDNCITNLACSVLSYYGAEAPHRGLPAVDGLLAALQPDHIVVLLADGLGSRILERTLPENSFLRKNHFCDISSVFPPTTVAATTSMLSGLNPSETAWLGWDTWFPDEGQSVTTYLNVVKDTDQKIEGPNLAELHMPYTHLRDRLNATGNVTANEISPYGDMPYKKPSRIPDMIRSLPDCGPRFLYVYLIEPDEKLHLFGTGSLEAAKKIEEIDRLAEEIFDALPERSVLIVTADHGHLNATFESLADYPELFGMLSHNTSMDPRAASLFVKDGMQEEFRRLFEKTFGSDFLLFTREEALEKELFGPGEIHGMTERIIGDFVAAAVSDNCLYYNGGPSNMKSTHAGMTEDEMLIPVCAVSK